MSLRPVITVIIIALILGSIGCAPSAPPQIEQPLEEEGVRVPQDESFDPASIKEDDNFKLPTANLKTRTVSQQGEADETASITFEVMEVAGYRVQLYVTRDEFEARAVEEEALLTFDGSVYLIFDSPNYKIRIGDCTTRKSANELRDKAQKAGYRDAWVIQSKILIPKQ
ncbi:SPOR domain-containing protein [bacterium]|nr:SPOR domain-containing protein [bacterium]MBU1652740.1 SPOR domain-containing protein [bacterium]